MTVVQVVPGVCGLETRIVARADEMFRVSLEITSACERVQELGQRLRQLSALEELRATIAETCTYKTAAECRLHVSCPVPSAILKAVEVAAGMALPADVHMRISKD
ncbi:MAG: hypothetical protein J7M05_03630 [Anaerolineae bacterium]|nr:hypothetical protein [Anaerolineae bacterium]